VRIRSHSSSASCSEIALGHYRLLKINIDYCRELSNCVCYSKELHVHVCSVSSNLMTMREQNIWEGGSV
jgi:hypothetical protein